MRILIIASLVMLVSLGLKAQQNRPLSTYTLTTKVSAGCTSVVSLTLFEEGSGNDALNQMLIDEFLGTFMESKPIRKLSYFYEGRSFGKDSSFDFTIYTASTYVHSDIYSFTLCPKYACEKEATSTYETQMATFDATHKKFLELPDLFEASKMDTLEKFVFRIVNMYHVKSLPTCAFIAFNPNQIAVSNGALTATDEITYIKGLSPKFFLSEGKIHLYNKVKHRDYDYDDVEMALPMSKLKYFMKPEMVKRLGIQ